MLKVEKVSLTKTHPRILLMKILKYISHSKILCLFCKGLIGTINHCQFLMFYPFSGPVKHRRAKPKDVLLGQKRVKYGKLAEIYGIS